MKLKIFPEYHLGGYPPKGFYNQETAYQKMKDEAQDSIVIFGYSEIHSLDLYSSALIIDGDTYYNTRKSEPWGALEKKIYDFSDEIPAIHDLSIGKTLVVLCNDAFESNFGKQKYSKELWGNEEIDLIVIISYWKNGIDKFLINRGIKRLAKGTDCNKWILRDHFNGFRDSGNIDFKFS